MKKALLTALLLSCVALPAYANTQDKDNMAARLISKMDTNGDQAISITEHESFSAHMFRNIDSNEDNQLSHDEIMAYKAEDKLKSQVKWDGQDRSSGYNN